VAGCVNSRPLAFRPRPADNGPAGGKTLSWKLGNSSFSVSGCQRFGEDDRLKFGPNHAFVRLCMERLAGEYQSAGRWDNALHLFEDSRSRAGRDELSNSFHRSHRLPGTTPLKNVGETRDMSDTEFILWSAGSPGFLLAW
jgi:hypothetical protein